MLAPMLHFALGFAAASAIGAYVIAYLRALHRRELATVRRELLLAFGQPAHPVSPPRSRAEARERERDRARSTA